MVTDRVAIPTAFEAKQKGNKTTKQICPLHNLAISGGRPQRPAIGWPKSDRSATNCARLLQGCVFVVLVIKSSCHNMVWQEASHWKSTNQSG
jgi:hypothetical protein